MKLYLKRTLCFILSLVMLISTVVVSSAANNSCDCDYAPTIIIPGIGQSETFLVDEDGNNVIDDNGDVITGWPLYFDTDYAIKKLVVPLLLSLLLQSDIGLSTTTYETAKELVKWNSYNSDGENNFNIQVRKFPQSVAECTQEEKDYIYDCIPLNKLSEIAGEDHLYFFAYNSFGNNIAIVDELYEFIQQVKRETKHDKVNLAPISLGGTIANGLLDYYPEVVNDLNRVIYVVPALNGSNIVGDIFKGKLSTSDEMLYDYMFPALTDDKMTGNLINIALRILPKNVLLGFLDGLLNGLVEGLLLNCTTMWSLVPSEDYIECRDKWLSGSEHDVIRAQTDRYYQAQCNSLKNIQNLVDNGVEVFDIVDYSYPLYCLVESWNNVNADGIIQIESTGMGVESCYVNEGYPLDYQQKNINKLGTSNCADPTHNHISPDREVDASTCLLPDQTFFFYQQDHEDTGSNDVIMKLAVELFTNENMTDVYSNPKFPQFNFGRDTDYVINGLLPQAKSILAENNLTPEDAKALNDAIIAAEKMLDDTVVIPGELETVTKNIEDIFIKIGRKDPPEDETGNEIGGFILEKLNKLLNKTLGYKGFTDIFR